MPEEKTAAEKKAAFDRAIEEISAFSAHDSAKGGFVGAEEERRGYAKCPHCDCVLHVEPNRWNPGAFSLNLVAEPEE